MAGKDFREIQISSSLLVVIFLGVLALGVFVFLLGVSVGKKQAAIASGIQAVATPIQEPAKEPPAEAQARAAEPTAAPTASSPQTQAAAQEVAGTIPAPSPAGSGTKTTPTTRKTSAEKTSTAPKTAATGTGLYYVQVAAFTNRSQAAAASDRFKRMGYPVVIADPKPTDTKTWYRVRIGGYATREKAVEVLGKLNASAGKKTDYRVVRD
jgi:cell division septation protein DedD